MIPLLKTSLPPSSNLTKIITEVVKTGIIAEGEYVYDFEKKFLHKFGYKYGLAVSSGTAALHASLAALGIGRGDEVITTPMTAEPTNLSILHAGAVPVFADINLDDGNICPLSIKKSITKKTKAILVVHYGGYPAKMKEICKIAKDNGLKVIEDCAHALGASLDGNNVGSYGDFAIFSFQAIKQISTIDGGFIVFKNKKYLDFIKRFRWFGLTKGADRTKPSITHVGYKYNMNNISAAIGIEQLDRFDKILADTQKIGKIYNKQLSNTKNFHLCNFSGTPSYWLYSLFSRNSKKIINHLVKKGIASSKVHIPNNYHPLFRNDRLPNTKKFYERLIHIPCGFWVKQADAQKISEVIRGYDKTL